MPLCSLLEIAISQWNGNGAFGFSFSLSPPLSLDRFLYFLILEKGGGGGNGMDGRHERGLSSRPELEAEGATGGDLAAAAG